jgi:hypothetical protein
MMRPSMPFGSLPSLPNLGPGPGAPSSGFGQLDSFSNISSQAAQIANIISGLLQVLPEISKRPNFPEVVHRLVNMLFQSGSELV